MLPNFAVQKQHIMRKFAYIIIAILALSGLNDLNAQELSPYVLVGETDLTLENAEAKINEALVAKGFEILGSYHPEMNQTLTVIAYTRKDLKDITIQVKDRGVLAAALKVGLKADGPGCTISYLNPEYLFQAYLRDAFDKHESGLRKIANDVAETLSPFGTSNKGFGGAMTAKELREYHYKITMPYFSDPVELKEFSSFEEGVGVIEKNLAARKGDTKLVYSMKFTKEQTAVFGIGLLNQEDGEKEFLPIIGEDHLAAMPYEIILQGRQATMLHGRYRFALHWPELTMGTFMRISSAPGYVKDVFKDLCE